MQGDSKDAELGAEVFASETELGPEDDSDNDEVRGRSEQAIAEEGKERHRAITEARAPEPAPEAAVPNAETKKKLDALETTMAIGGMPSSEIKKLIADPKMHSYHMDALRAAYSARLAAEASR
jgi:hypothetical protein